VDAIARVYDDTTWSRIPQQRCGSANVQVSPPPPPPPPPLPKVPAGGSATFARTAFGDTVEISYRAIAVSVSLREPEPESLVGSGPAQDATPPGGLGGAAGVGAAPAPPEAPEAAEAAEADDEFGTPEDESGTSVEDAAGGTTDHTGGAENPVDETPGGGADEAAPGQAQNAPKCERQPLALLYPTGAEPHADERGQDEPDQDADGAGTDADGDPTPDGQSRRRTPARWYSA
jgi:hypothetical protein